MIDDKKMSITKQDAHFIVETIIKEIVPLIERQASVMDHQTSVINQQTALIDKLAASLEGLLGTYNDLEHRVGCIETELDDCPPAPDAQH